MAHKDSCKLNRIKIEKHIGVSREVRDRLRWPMIRLYSTFLYLQEDSYRFGDFVLPMCTVGHVQWWDCEDEPWTEEDAALCKDLFTSV